MILLSNFYNQIFAFVKILIIILLCLVINIALGFASDFRFASNCKQENYDSINKYLNSFVTLQANFVEQNLEDTLSASDIKKQFGILYIDKPGKLRFQYQKPNKNFIVLNYKILSYYDNSLDEISQIPTSNLSEAIFMLASKTIMIENYKSIKGCKIQDSEMFVIAQDNEDRNVIITFAVHPIVIKEISSLNSENIIVSKISLSDVIYNKKIDKQLFEIKDNAFMNDDLSENR